MLISVGFIGCWSPYGLVSLWSVLQDSSTISPQVSLLPCMFAKSSTVYNPLIYYIFSQNFKTEVKQLCQRCVGSSVSDGIKVNSIYMASGDTKSREVTRTTSQEISESHAVILGWKPSLPSVFLGKKDFKTDITIMLKKKKEKKKKEKKVRSHDYLSGKHEPVLWRYHNMPGDAVWCTL